MSKTIQTGHSQKELTIHDVAAKAQVAISTVSRVLNDMNRVSPKTRERVQQAITDLGYAPNSRARSLSGKRTNTIGLVVPDFTGDYFTELMEGAHAEALASGLLIMVLKAKGAKEKVESVRRLLSEKRVDGLILMLSESHEAVLNRIEKVEAPLVVLDKDVGRRKLDCVLVDNRSASYEAAQHLAEVHGIRKLLYLGGPSDNIDSQNRAQGVQDLIRSREDLLDHELIFAGSYDYDDGYRVAQGSILPRIRSGLGDAEPWGIVAANDNLACGAVDALLDHGIEVPRQVAVIGFDDSPTAVHRRMRLSSVRIPLREIGEQAIRIICKRLGGGDRQNVKIELRSELIVRESCGCGDSGKRELANVGIETKVK